MVQDCPVIQIFVGVVVLAFVFAWEAVHAADLITKLLPRRGTSRVWVSRVLRGILAIIATVLVIEPAIPGFALVEIHAPKRFPTTLDNLTVRAGPAGCFGPRDAAQWRNGTFDRSGVALVRVPFRPYQSTLIVEALDNSRENSLVKTKDAHVSPFVKVGLSKLVVLLDQEGS